MTRAKLLVTICQIEWSRSLEYASKNTAILSALFLLACLGSVVLLAKELSPMLETMVADMDAPKTLVGIVIAAVVLLPESIAAFKPQEPTVYRPVST